MLPPSDSLRKRIDPDASGVCSEDNDDGFQESKNKSKFLLYYVNLQGLYCEKIFSSNTVKSCKFLGHSNPKFNNILRLLSTKIRNAQATSSVS